MQVIGHELSVRWDEWFQFCARPDSRVEFDSSGVLSRWNEMPDSEMDSILRGIVYKSKVLDLCRSVLGYGKYREMHGTISSERHRSGLSRPEVGSVAFSWGKANFMTCV